MTQITRTIHMEAPLDKVFAYTSNYKNWSEFYEGISDVKPLTDNTSSTGSKFIYKIKIVGMTFTVGTEFQEYTKNKGWKGKSFKGVEHQTQWTFLAKDGSTEFTHGVNYSLPLYFGGKLFDQLLMKSAWVRLIEKSLQNLKSKVEAG